jgi:hypothetical protein
MDGSEEQSSAEKVVDRRWKNHAHPVELMTLHEPSVHIPKRASYPSNDRQRPAANKGGGPRAGGLRDIHPTCAREGHICACIAQPVIGASGARTSMKKPRGRGFFT